MSEQIVVHSSKGGGKRAFNGWATGKTKFPPTNHREAIEWSMRWSDPMRDLQELRVTMAKEPLNIPEYVVKYQTLQELRFERICGRITSEEYWARALDLFGLECGEQAPKVEFGPSPLKSLYSVWRTT